MTTPSNPQEQTDTGFTPGPQEMSCTCFGEGLDAFVRDAWGWPDDVVVHTVMVMNPDQKNTPDKTQIELKGGKPTGHNRRGALTFGLRKHDLRAVITLAQYRAAISLARGRLEQGLMAPVDENAPAGRASTPLSDGGLG